MSNFSGQQNCVRIFLAVIIVIIVIDETVNTVSAYFKDNNMSNSSQLQ